MPWWGWLLVAAAVGLAFWRLGAFARMTRERAGTAVDRPVRPTAFNAAPALRRLAPSLVRVN